MLHTALPWAPNTGGEYWVGWNEYSPAVHIGTTDHPLVNVVCPESWGWPAATRQIRIPSGVTGATGTDGELLVVNGSTVHNFWQFVRSSDTTATCQAYAAEDLSGDGWGQASPFLGAGIVASGSSQLAGLVLGSEASSIQHALGLVVNAPAHRPGHVAPAISGDGTVNGGFTRVGQRMRIAAGATMPSGLSSLGQAVWAALRGYGAFDIDTGGATSIRTQANAFSQSAIDTLRTEIGPLLRSLVRVEPAAAPWPTETTAPAGSRVGSYTASGSITAATGQVIEGLSFLGTANLIIPNGVSGVVVSDCLFDGQGDAVNKIVVQGHGNRIEHCTIRNCKRGILVSKGGSGQGGNNNTIYKCRLDGTAVHEAPENLSHAIQIAGGVFGAVTGCLVWDNYCTGSGYMADILSLYECSHNKVIGNWVEGSVASGAAAPFTVGDSATGTPSGDNYVAGNYFRLTGATGVQAGVFGSSGFTLLEQNCFASGVQAYNYIGGSNATNFIGVYMRSNAIDSSNVFTDDDLPDILQWSTNYLAAGLRTPADVPGGRKYLHPRTGLYVNAGTLV
jgi:hypothetical protein